MLKQVYLVEGMAWVAGEIEDVAVSVEAESEDEAKDEFFKEFGQRNTVVIENTEPTNRVK